jgi:hypothetical protein
MCEENRELNRELNLSGLIPHFVELIPLGIACKNNADVKAFVAKLLEIIEDLKTNPTYSAIREEYSKLGDGKFLAMLVQLLKLLPTILPLFMGTK